MRMKRYVYKLLVLAALLLSSACVNKDHLSDFHTQTSGVWSTVRHDVGLSYHDYRMQLREDLQALWEQRIAAGKVTHGEEDAGLIAEAMTPADGKSLCVETKGAVLLIHGLFDSPYVMNDLGGLFNQQCFDTRFVLLPYHGTQPGDLVVFSAAAWKATVAYATDSLANDFSDQRLYIAGFSTA